MSPPHLKNNSRTPWAHTSPPVSWAFSAALGGPTCALMSRAEICDRVLRTSGEAQDGRASPWARWGEKRRGLQEGVPGFVVCAHVYRLEVTCRCSPGLAHLI